MNRWTGVMVWVSVALAFVIVLRLASNGPAAERAPRPSVPLPAVETPVQALADEVRTLTQSVSGLTACVEAVKAATESMHHELVSVTDRVAVLEAPSVLEPPECVCTCDCPTVTEVQDVVRQVVREERDRPCEARTEPPRPVPIASPVPYPVPAAVPNRGLNPGERIVAIDGVPVKTGPIQGGPYQGGLFRGGLFQSNTPATCNGPGCR